MDESFTYTLIKRKLKPLNCPQKWRIWQVWLVSAKHRPCSQCFVCLSWTSDWFSLEMNSAKKNMIFSQTGLKSTKRRTKSTRELIITWRIYSHFPYYHKLFNVDGHPKVSSCKGATLVLPLWITVTELEMFFIYNNIIHGIGCLFYSLKLLSVATWYIYI